MLAPLLSFDLIPPSTGQSPTPTVIQHVRQPMHWLTHTLIFMGAYLWSFIG